MELFLIALQYHKFLLKEHAVFNLASYSTIDPVFEIYSQYDIVLISKELKHREKFSKFPRTLLVRLLPYIFFHNQNPVTYSI